MQAEEKRGPILLNREDSLAMGVFADKRFISSIWILYIRVYIYIQVDV